MTKITTIGLDLAKNVFQVHGVDTEGKVIVARQLRRKQVLAFFAKLPPCLVGMEACGSAHYWAREITKLGHTVKLMPPKYVKAYVKRGKTDAGDAAAICEAVSRPSMTFVPVKGVEQQGCRCCTVSARSWSASAHNSSMPCAGTSPSLVSSPSEACSGSLHLQRLSVTKADERLPMMARAALLVVINQIETISAEITKLDTALRKENKASDIGRRLETIPSVGPVIASAFRARVTKPDLFENGRHLAAWIGIVPENDSTGGKPKQKGLSKKGDRYLRALLVNGAMAIVRQARMRPDRYPWVAGLLTRMSAKQAAIAIANKTARIAWVVMVRGGVYEAGHRAPAYRGAALSAACGGVNDRACDKEGMPRREQGSSP